MGVRRRGNSRRRKSDRKVRVLSERKSTDIEEAINDLIEEGYTLRGDVKITDTGASHGSTGKTFIATMIKDD